jgi:hypothetical protein
MYSREAYGIYWGLIRDILPLLTRNKKSGRRCKIFLSAALGEIPCIPGCCKSVLISNWGDQTVCFSTDFEGNVEEARGWVVEAD